MARTGKQNKCSELCLSMVFTGIDLHHLSCLKLEPKSKQVKQDPFLVSREKQSPSQDPLSHLKWVTLTWAKLFLFLSWSLSFQGLYRECRWGVRLRCQTVWHFRSEALNSVFSFKDDDAWLTVSIVEGCFQWPEARPWIRKLFITSPRTPTYYRSPLYHPSATLDQFPWESLLQLVSRSQANFLVLFLHPLESFFAANQNLKNKTRDRTSAFPLGFICSLMHVAIGYNSVHIRSDRFT